MPVSPPVKRRAPAVRRREQYQSVNRSLWGRSQQTSVIRASPAGCLPLLALVAAPLLGVGMMAPAVVLVVAAGTAVVMLRSRAASAVVCGAARATD